MTYQQEIACVKNYNGLNYDNYMIVVKFQSCKDMHDCVFAHAVVSMHDNNYVIMIQN